MMKLWASLCTSSCETSEPVVGMHLPLASSKAMTPPLSLCSRTEVRHMCPISVQQVVNRILHGTFLVTGDQGSSRGCQAGGVARAMSGRLYTPRPTQEAPPRSLRECVWQDVRESIPQLGDTTGGRTQPYQRQTEAKVPATPSWCNLRNDTLIKQVNKPTEWKCSGFSMPL